MELAALIRALAPEEVVGQAAADIRDLTYDARTAVPGSLFFCVAGTRADGHEFASAAVGNGAVALVVDRRLEIEVPQVVVSDVRAAMAIAA